jgi:ATP-dependent protease ClpP protease subunit
MGSISLPKLLGWAIGLCCAVMAAGSSGGTKPFVDKPKFSVREEPGRIVLAWSGPVAEPMREEISAALNKYGVDRRPIVLSLNSPGGSIAYGRTVAGVVRSASREHAIDTIVEQGSVCASMCVPIYLSGTERLAHAAARFMFHMASLDPAERSAAKCDEAAASRYRKVLETLTTNDLFQNDIGRRGVSAAWLARMRAQIDGRDVWTTGQQLVSEGSGVVDRLVTTAAR